MKYAEKIVRNSDYGYLCGRRRGLSRLYWGINEHAQQRVQMNPHSIQGDIGGYLCSAGWLPIQLGVLGAALGITTGAGVGIGGIVWTGMKEPESERE